MEAPRNSSKDPWKDRAGPRARARCAGKPETARRPNGGRGRLVAAAHVHARFRGRAEFRAVCLSVKAEEQVRIVATGGDGWVVVSNSSGRSGLVPLAYLQPSSE